MAVVRRRFDHGGVKAMKDCIAEEIGYKVVNEKYLLKAKYMMIIMGVNSLKGLRDLKGMTDLKGVDPSDFMMTVHGHERSQIDYETCTSWSRGLVRAASATSFRLSRLPCRGRAWVGSHESERL